nr:uncharacterized protein LOC128689286 isoform X1 [Cherax quadricarinatus]XP_053633394.1 uncharacterized protein LOC128689286 isoform X1 [Cherax quadricarinatus]XP_053633395.1 uncharacterized protein LOC128689286 isoform X1 [Cherax quadricarinatus]XP_053633396.1 uncharacterized protein LOC128689286 isoform X1 [Cherax quadricarinatus]
MDVVENTLVTTSHIAGSMNYPSTMQALFALIVMIIVLLFILVYCCWGTFSCTRQEDTSAAAEDGTPVTQHQGQQVLRGTHMVIVPINNMIYVGDPETRRIYQIPIDRDKPPAYTEAVSSGPPPPYVSDNSTSDNTVQNLSQAVPETRTVLPDLPPSYDDCLSSSFSNEVWHTVVNNHVSASESWQVQPNGQFGSDTGGQQPPELASNSMTIDGLDQRVTEAPGGRLESVILLPSNLRTVLNPHLSPENGTDTDCDKSLNVQST